MEARMCTVFLLPMLFVSLVQDACGKSKDEELSHDAKLAMKKRLLLISFDGFRWDYLNGRSKTPHFDAMRQKGVIATKGLVNTFLSNTLPNHYSLVTGLYVESHGFIDNFMVDPGLNQSFIPKYHDKNSVNHPDWHNTAGEPIWVGNQLRKKGGRSGVIMWMGGEAAIKGVRPFRHMPYDNEVPDKKKVDTIINWLTSKQIPINLGVIYFQEPDKVGHKYGPDSVQVIEKIEELDGVVGYLFQRLADSNLENITDVIITSDHGILNVGKDKIIVLDNIVDPGLYKHASFIPGAVAGIIPNEGKEDVIYRDLKVESERTNSFIVYKKSDIPERFHYRNHRRVPAIFAMAMVGYTFVKNETAAEEFVLAGNHGYDNELEAMHPFFIASGPSFKEDVAVETFQNVDIYPLMCFLLQIRPAPHNGSMSVVLHLIREELTNNVPKAPDNSLLLALTVLGMMSAFVFSIYLREHKFKKP